VEWNELSRLEAGVLGENLEVVERRLAGINPPVDALGLADVSE
jgi:hypothetical protein